MLYGLCYSLMNCLGARDGAEEQPNQNERALAGARAV